MTTRHWCTLAFAACLLIPNTADGQHAQKDLDRVFDGNRAIFQTLESAWPAFNMTTDELVSRGLAGPRETLRTRRFVQSKAAIFLLTQQTSQSWDVDANGGAGDWLDVDRIRFTRNDAGVVIGFLGEDWDVATSAWIPSFRRTTTVNDENRAVETLDESWNEDLNGGQGDWEPAGRSTFTYNAQGSLAINTTEFWDEDQAQYVVFWRTTRTYDGSGQRVTQSLFESALFGPLGPSSRTSFEYNSGGNVTREYVERYDTATAQWENSRNELNTYDGNGEAIEELVQSWDPAANGGQGGWVNLNRTLNTFTPDSGNPTGITETDQFWDIAANGGQGGWVNDDRWVTTFTVGATNNTIVDTYQKWDAGANGGQGDWANDSRDVVTLTPEGEYVEIISQNWDPAAGGGQGDWVDDTRDSVVEDERGLIIEALTERWDGAMWVNESRLLQTFDEFTSTALEGDITDSRYELEANYPNPFTVETTIRFALPTAEHVTLEVFDLLGRRVTTLVDGLTPPGKHAVTLRRGDLAGGLYVYRLHADNVTASRTMLLLN